MNTKTPIFLNNLYYEEIISVFTHFELLARVKDDLLYGNYEPEYKTPNWYNFLVNHKNEEQQILLINLDKSSIEQQKRFTSLAKDRSIETLVLPNNCHLVFTASDINDVDKELLGYTIRV